MQIRERNEEGMERQEKTFLFPEILCTQNSVKIMQITERNEEGMERQEKTFLFPLPPRPHISRLHREMHEHVTSLQICNFM